MNPDRAPPRLLFLWLFLLCFIPDFALASSNPPVGGGGSCTQVTVSDGTQSTQMAYDAGLYGCNSSGAWVPDGILHGNAMGDGTTPSCNSTNAGMIVWTGSAFQGCNGTSWITFINSIQTAVPTMSSTGLSTWVNQGTATETDGATGMQLAISGVSSGQPMSMLCKTAPSTPYSIISELSLTTNGQQWGGLAWRNTSNSDVESFDIWVGENSSYDPPGTFQLVGFQAQSPASSAYTGVTWGNTASASLPGAPITWLKLKNDGTKMYEYWSYDGASWVLAYSENLSGSYLGATGYNQVCIQMVGSSGGNSQILTLMSYQQTSP
jgi:hypothetical protein